MPLSSRGIVLQGATKGVGKSLTLLALYCFFQREGLKAAPLKVVEDGELTKMAGNRWISSSIWYQQKSMGQKILEEMNPFFCQRDAYFLRNQPIALEGEALSYKIREEMKRSKASLGREYDLLLIEGTGSPGDIHDRRRAISSAILSGSDSCPIILIADIDRGGSFASLYGSLQVLSLMERKRVKGFLFNGFRGNKESLLPGLEWLEKKTSIPVLGVLPYLEKEMVRGCERGERESAEEVGEAFLSHIDAPLLRRLVKRKIN